MSVCTKIDEFEAAHHLTQHKPCWSDYLWSVNNLTHLYYERMLHTIIFSKLKTEAKVPLAQSPQRLSHPLSVLCIQCPPFLQLFNTSINISINIIYSMNLIYMSKSSKIQLLPCKQQKWSEQTERHTLEHCWGAQKHPRECWTCFHGWNQ